ncbi:MAG: FTR1 family protein [Bacteroidota bacterium]|nr:FTR1 family protein [Bacteroidota bacterium]MDP4228962.1 FTR1 family protein [Bacteroidota bacterium]MDP4236843.1 FTR1 family protein [Bacteroidota bacterium]
MFEKIFNQFVICFREGTEASLVIMAVMVAIKKRGDDRFRKAALWGIGTAIVFCIAGGWYLGSIALVTTEGHLLELVLYISAMLAVTGMVFWMMKTGKNLRSEIEKKVNSYDNSKKFLPLAGVFLFVFFMIAREGFETVLLLLSFGAGIGGHYYVVAMLMGIAVAVLLSYALSKGLIKVHIGKFLQQTAFVLLFFVIQLFFDSLHEAYEGNFLPQPSSQGWANFVDYVHDQMPIFSYIALGLFGIIIIYHLVQSIGKRRPPQVKPAA